MSKPILLICGCRKYEEYLHAAIRRSDRPEYEIIGLIGDSSKELQFNPESRILTLPIADTYEALPAKLHAAFAWIHTNRPGVPGVFKTDDDMIFDMDALVSNILAHIDAPYWGVTASICRAGPVDEHRIQHRFEDKSLRPSYQTAAYCFGAGYWISKVALPVIVAAGDIYKDSALEDVCTGFVMNRAGIMPSRFRFPYKEMPRTHELLAYK